MVKKQNGKKWTGVSPICFVSSMAIRHLELLVRVVAIADIQ